MDNSVTGGRKFIKHGFANKEKICKNCKSYVDGKCIEISNKEEYFSNPYDSNGIGDIEFTPPPETFGCELFKVKVEGLNG